MRRFLDPKNDFAFKRLFGTKDNKGILIAFLNAIFEGIHKPILDVEFLPTVQNPEIAFLKESIVDVLCHDTAGKHYIVEMQCSSDSFFLKRACYYASKVYTGQIQAGQPFSNLKEVIFLVIFKDRLFPKKQEYLSHHKFHDICTGQCDIEEFTFSFLELGKINKELEECENMIEQWAHFFHHAPEVDPDAIPEIIKNCTPIREAYDAIGEWGYNKVEMLEYDRRAMKMDEIATGLADAEKKGKAEEKRDMVIGMHRKEIDKALAC